MPALKLFVSDSSRLDDVPVTKLPFAGLARQALGYQEQWCQFRRLADTVGLGTPPRRG